MSNALANGLAGAGGGIIAQIITYPLQTVITRQQTERSKKKDNPVKKSSTIVQILQVIENEGLNGLYSGFTPSLLGTATSQGVYYYFYQIFKNKAEKIAAIKKAKGYGDGSIGMFSWLAVAALAGSLNVLLTNPIWVIVTRMQTQAQAAMKIDEGKKKLLLVDETSKENSEWKTLQPEMPSLSKGKVAPYGTMEAVQDVYREAGLLGFWKGLVPTLIMVCNPSLQFMIYETSLKHLNSRRQKRSLVSEKTSAMEVFLLGALAKMGATVSTYPLLVVKSRLQAKQVIGGSSSLRYSGTIDAIAKIIRHEGWSSFYKGMSAKIVQSVFSAAVLFMIKEELVKMFLLFSSKSRRLLLKSAP